MAKIPDAMSLGGRPQLAVVRAAPVSRSQLMVADSLQSANTSLVRAAANERQKADKFAYASARSALLQADIEARRTLENDPDWGTYEKRYTEAMGKAREKAIGLIRDKADAADFEMQTDLDLQRGAAEIRAIARGKEVDWGRSTLEEHLARNRESALNAKDEGSRAALVAESNALIDGAIQKGYVKQEEAGTVRRNWAANYGEGVVEMLSPAEQVKLLSKPQGTPADFIDPAKRAQLLDRAKKEVEQDQRALEADRRARKAEARADFEWQQRQSLDLAQKHLAAGGTIATMPKSLWRGLDGGAQLSLQNWEAERIKKLEEGRKDDDVGKYVEVQREIEAGNITDSQQLAQYAPYLKDDTLKTLDGVIRNRGNVSADRIKSEFTLRKGKTESRWGESDRNEYIAFQRFITKNVSDSKNPDNVGVWADKWFMEGRTLQDAPGREPSTYGAAVVAGREDFVVDVPQADRAMNDNAYRILWLNGATGDGTAADDTDLFYTRHFLEARRILSNNQLTETEENIAAVAALRAAGAPTTPANIEEARRQLTDVGNTGPRSRR